LLNPQEQLKLHRSLQQNGIKAKRQNHFINGLVKKAGKIEHILRLFVSNAQKHLKRSLRAKVTQDFAQIIADQNGAEIRVSITSKKIVWAVDKYLSQINMQEQHPALENVQIKRGKGRKISQVFNLTVDGEHEYFADNLLVANCDATRYTVAAIPWDFSDLELSPKVEEELRKEKAPKLEKTQIELRREFTLGIGPKSDDSFDIGEEFDFWNELIGVSE
jgi:hypothetical protein